MTVDTYLFYDLETSGLSPVFDQILSFAAIRTAKGPNLEVVAPPVEIKVRLRPDVTPTPGAILTNRITVANATAEDAKCEYEAIGQIHQMVNEPGTTSVGFNSLSFDDKFLRFSFYRNLLEPYTHQGSSHPRYDSGCGRADMMVIALMYWLWGSDCVKWPYVNGESSFRLEDFDRDNDLTRGAPHSAAADAEATMALARCFRSESGLWWRSLMRFSKKSDQQALQRLPGYDGLRSCYKRGLLTAVWLGAERGYQAPVLDLGYNRNIGRSIFLRLDLEQLSTMTKETVCDAPYVTKLPGVPPFVLQPDEILKVEMSLASRSICEDNLRWLCANPDLLEAIKRYRLAYRYPPVAEVDLDAALYDPRFFQRSKVGLPEFHNGTIEEKGGLLGRIECKESRALAARILGRNYPDALPFAHARGYHRYLDQRHSGTGWGPVISYDGTAYPTSIQYGDEYYRRLGQEDLNQEDRRLLSEWNAFLENRFRRFMGEEEPDMPEDPGYVEDQGDDLGSWYP
jgi:exodeoxyribonuclease-1